MCNEISVYKIIGSTPSIYAEVNESKGKFNLSLMKENELIEKRPNMQCGQAFYINTPGTYTVIVNYSDGTYTSNEVVFHSSEFIKTAEKALFFMQENKLSTLKRTSLF